ncbi:hypothetical protein Tcan_00161 [Toxocara canis]|uniref:Uncharacterized protein n=1 Tax=Toxocara canis TaxID=6265 RepID=A0A0B2VQG6_TOXCA|nr:hypothetical protein Tcan_00161 [Toxocara canis]
MLKFCWLQSLSVNCGLLKRNLSYLHGVSGHPERVKFAFLGVRSLSYRRSGSQSSLITLTLRMAQMVAHMFTFQIVHTASLKCLLITSFCCNCVHGKRTGNSLPSNKSLYQRRISTNRPTDVIHAIPIASGSAVIHPVECHSIKLYKY